MDKLTQNVVIVSDAFYSIMYDLMVESSPDLRIMERVLAQLVHRYTEPHRHYHDLGHISNLLQLYNRSTDYSLDPVVPLAILYHDVIYDIPPSRNEDNSIEFLRVDAKLLGLKSDLVEQAAQYINSTKLKTSERNLMTDLDLSGLSDDWETFAENTHNIVLEYTTVYPQHTVITGRLLFWKTFLESGNIYHSDFFKPFESTARENIAREISFLEKGELPK